MLSSCVCVCVLCVRRLAPCIRFHFVSVEPFIDIVFGIRWLYSLALTAFSLVLCTIRLCFASNRIWHNQVVLCCCRKNGRKKIEIEKSSFRALMPMLALSFFRLYFYRLNVFMLFVSSAYCLRVWVCAVCVRVAGISHLPSVCCAFVFYFIFS